MAGRLLTGLTRRQTTPDTLVYLDWLSEHFVFHESSHPDLSSATTETVPCIADAADDDTLKTGLGSCLTQKWYTGFLFPKRAPSGPAGSPISLPGRDLSLAAACVAAQLWDCSPLFALSPWNGLAAAAQSPRNVSGPCLLLSPKSRIDRSTIDNRDAVERASCSRTFKWMVVRGRWVQSPVPSPAAARPFRLLSVRSTYISHFSPELFLIDLKSIGSSTGR